MWIFPLAAALIALVFAGMLRNIVRAASARGSESAAQLP